MQICDVAAQASLLSYLEQVHTGIKGVVSLEGNTLHQVKS